MVIIEILGSQEPDDTLMKIREEILKEMHRHRTDATSNSEVYFIKDSLKVPDRKIAIKLQTVGHIPTWDYSLAKEVERDIADILFKNIAGIDRLLFSTQSMNSIITRGILERSKMRKYN